MLVYSRNGGRGLHAAVRDPECLRRDLLDHGEKREGGELETIGSWDRRVSLIFAPGVPALVPSAKAEVGFRH